MYNPMKYMDPSGHWPVGDDVDPEEYLRLPEINSNENNLPLEMDVQDGLDADNDLYLFLLFFVLMISEFDEAELKTGVYISFYEPVRQFNDPFTFSEEVSFYWRYDLFVQMDVDSIDWLELGTDTLGLLLTLTGAGDIFSGIPETIEMGLDIYNNVSQEDWEDITKDFGVTVLEDQEILFDGLKLAPVMGALFDVTSIYDNLYGNFTFAVLNISKVEGIR
jgi:hypothetical protein